MAMNFRKYGTKYNNNKVEYMGMTFDSQKERDRYIVLKSYESKGTIQNLRCQVYYDLLPKVHYLKEQVLKTKTKFVERELFDKEGYKADFVYEYNGQTIVDDVKGSKAIITDKFKLKQKLMWHINKIIVLLVFDANAPLGKNPIVTEKTVPHQE